MQKKAKILIIYTGGTIGMMKTSTGYKPMPGLLERHMAQMPEFKHSAMPDYDLHEYKELLDSADMSPADWNAIAQDIYRYYQQYDAFLVLHGTDTMAYTASALSFMLSGLNKPVILTGSQVPLVEAHTDARENLINAMLIAGSYQIPEVCVFFNNTLLRGNRTRKTNAYGFDAFTSPNFPELGEVGINISLKTELLLPFHNKNTLKLQNIQSQTIAKFSFFPGADIRVLEALLKTPLHALILETYGVGNAPVKQAGLIELLNIAAEKNILVLNTSQCLKGTIDMESYVTGQALAAHGVLSCYDMTPETIITKLYYLLSNSELDMSARKQLFKTSLRGELTVF